jgi:hypothetical protein
MKQGKFDSHIVGVDIVFYKALAYSGTTNEKKCL